MYWKKENFALQSERKNTLRLLMVTLLLAAVLPFFGQAMQLILPSTPSGYYVGLMIQEIVLWGLPALALMVRRDATVRQRRVERYPRPTVFQGVFACLMGLWLQSGLSVLFALEGVTSGLGVAVPSTGMEWGLAVLAFVGLPALCEESFFRGVLQRTLAKSWGLWGGAIASAGLFALMHGTGMGLLPQLVVGATSALCMAGTGSLLVCVLFHLGYNGGALLLTLIPASPWLMLGLPLWGFSLVWLWTRRKPVVQKEKRRMTLLECVLLAAVLAVMGVRYW